MTVLTLNIHHKGSRGLEIPVSMKNIFFGVVAKVLFIKLDLLDPPSPGMVSSIVNILRVKYYPT